MFLMTYQKHPQNLPNILQLGGFFYRSIFSTQQHGGQPPVVASL